MDLEYHNSQKKHLIVKQKKTFTQKNMHNLLILIFQILIKNTFVFICPTTLLWISTNSLFIAPSLDTSYLVPKFIILFILLLSNYSPSLVLQIYRHYLTLICDFLPSLSVSLLCTFFYVCLSCSPSCTLILVFPQCAHLFLCMLVMLTIMHIILFFLYFSPCT